MWRGCFLCQVCVRTTPPPPPPPPLWTVAAPASPSSLASAAICTWTMRRRRMTTKTTVSYRRRSRVWVEPDRCSAACRIHTPSAASGTGRAAARLPPAQPRRRRRPSTAATRSPASGAAQVRSCDITLITWSELSTDCESEWRKWCVTDGETTSRLQLSIQLMQET